MTENKEHKEFIKDFVAMQAEMPVVFKAAQGQSGSHKFKYADLNEIVTTIRPILAQHGFAFMQHLETIDGETYLRTELHHKSGNCFSSPVKIEFKGENIKLFGASITYYRRYALQALLGIVADDDADAIKDNIVKDKSSIDHTSYIKKFVEKNGGDPALLKEFFTKKAKYNSWTIIETVNHAVDDLEAFNKEFNIWKTQNGK